MAGMDHDSYWHGYFMARHHTSLIMGIVLESMALIFALTGRCLVRYKGFVSRAEDPRAFWQNVSVYFLLGLFCFVLWAYTG